MNWLLELLWTSDSWKVVFRMKLDEKWIFSTIKCLKLETKQKLNRSTLSSVFGCCWEIHTRLSWIPLKCFQLENWHKNEFTLEKLEKIKSNSMKPIVKSCFPSEFGKLVSNPSFALFYLELLKKMLVCRCFDKKTKRITDVKASNGTLLQSSSKFWHKFWWYSATAFFFNWVLFSKIMKNE